MPNTDLRIQLSFRDHPKRRKLERRLGKAGVLGLIWLWAHAAANKPDGLLAGMDAEDLALAAEWDGEPEVFVGCLLELRLLDQTEDGYRVHDWPVHNPWAAKAEERSQLARAAAQARWDAERMRGAVPKDAERMPPAPNGNAPLLPLPSPSISKPKDMGGDPPPAMPEDVLSELRARYPDQALLDRTFAAIASTRKSNQVAGSVLAGLLRWCAGHSAEAVEGGMRRYLDGGHADQGRGEAYLKGIIKNWRSEEARRGPGLAVVKGGSSESDAYAGF